jgi:hypothetical protein
MTIGKPLPVDGKVVAALLFIPESYLQQAVLFTIVSTALYNNNEQV